MNRTALKVPVTVCMRDYILRALVSLFALRGKTPVWGFSPKFVRAGALIGVRVDPRAQAIQADAPVRWPTFIYRPEK